MLRTERSKRETPTGRYTTNLTFTITLHTMQFMPETLVAFSDMHHAAKVRTVFRSETYGRASRALAS